MGGAINWNYAGLWERLVDGEIQIHPVTPLVVTFDDEVTVMLVDGGQTALLSVFAAAEAYVAEGDLDRRTHRGRRRCTTSSPIDPDPHR